MTEAASISLELGGEAEAQELVGRVSILSDQHHGREATFKLVAEVVVHDSRPINETSVIHEETFTIAGPEHVVRIPRHEIYAYSYSGNKIDIDIHTQLVIDDAMFFDTKVSREQELELGLKPPADEDADAIVEPDDGFHFFTNLSAIPFHNQLITLGLVIVGGIVILVNMAIGAHDQFSPTHLTYFYDHIDSDGDYESPIVKALVGSGGLGLAVWMAMKNQLRKYMKFHLKKLPDMIRPEVEYSAASFFAGRSRVPLDNVTLRIVASNMEHGQYVRGSGTDRRTVSFSEPIRGVILYEKQVSSIPARVPIAPYFDGRFMFTPMFDLLYPPFMTSSTHGIGVHWEIQLLHPEFVDQEMVGPDDVFAYEDFLRP